MARSRNAIAYRPADLSEVPAIDELLQTLGLGPFQPQSIRSVLGRNNNWIGTTTGGQEVFVKQLHDGDRQARLARTEHVARSGEKVLTMPALLGVDRTASLIAMAYLPDAETAATLAARDEFSTELARAAGGQIGTLHRLPCDGFDQSPHPLPPVQAFAGLSLPYYLQASAAEIEMWRLLQGDQALADALRTLREQDDAGRSPRTPIHGDLRLDQFLITADSVHLSDFEEARAGDPARDIGAFAGEWLYLAATATPATLAGSLMVGQTATHAQIVATGVAEIERRSPMVTAFLDGYVTSRPAARSDETLVRRAAQFAGWHMLDRMLASAATTQRLSPTTKAAAGIGRTLLLNPDDFASTLGLELPC
ncbi:MAG TPA: class V lanthionine synthetase subunit LxmK [Jatrophihabitans sp.]|nr:class V lanthionine synthetase subunit LxmK [Jatrophihabitans sp.]